VKSVVHSKKGVTTRTGKFKEGEEREGGDGLNLT
jgi:hypothetical protein